MTRAELWVQFALGAIGQFPTGALAASNADDLLREFEERFEVVQLGDRHQGWRMKQHHVERLKLGGR